MGDVEEQGVASQARDRKGWKEEVKKLKEAKLLDERWDADKGDFDDCRKLSNYWPWRSVDSAWGSQEDFNYSFETASTMLMSGQWNGPNLRDVAQDGMVDEYKTRYGFSREEIVELFGSKVRQQYVAELRKRKVESIDNNEVKGPPSKKSKENIPVP